MIELKKIFSIILFSLLIVWLVAFSKDSQYPTKLIIEVTDKKFETKVNEGSWYVIKLKVN